MTRIGYAPLGANDRDCDLQIARLAATASQIFRSEVAAASMRVKRIELEAIVKCLHAGDELVVVRVDHVAHSARDVLKLIQELASRGASLRILEPEVTTSGDTGQTVVTTLSMIADLELKVMKDRQRAGIEAGRAAGSYKGRLKSVDDDEIRRRVAAGESKTAIARAMNISRMTIYRAMSATDGGFSEIVNTTAAKEIGSMGEDGS